MWIVRLIYLNVTSAFYPPFQRKLRVTSYACSTKNAENKMLYSDMGNTNRETLALNQPAPEICKSDSEMNASARKKQSGFRREVLRVPYDASDRFGKYGVRAALSS